MRRWGEEPVTFDSSDTLHSALAKLEGSGSGPVFVVLDPRCRIANNVLTYRLIARASERYGCPIAVVSGNPMWRRLAREQGLEAYGSVASLRRARRHSLLSRPEALADALISSLHPANLRLREEWPIVGAMLVVVGIAAFLVLPVMKVTIHTPVEPLTREVNARVDASAPSVDASSGTIPGRIIEHRFSVSDFVETTGSKSVGKERARGEVTIINSGPGLVVLPAGTILSTATGERFSLAATVTVGPFTEVGSPPQGPATTPAAGGTPTPPGTSGSGASGVIVRAPVTAVEPGEKGNVAALAISKVEGDAFRGLTVFNEQPLTGGTGQKARSVTAEDRSRLKEALFQRAQSISLSELTVRVRQSESLIPQSMQVHIDGEEFDKAVDEEGDRLRGSLYVIATALAFANQELNALVEREWKSSVPQGYRALASALKLAPPEVQEATSRTARLRVKATGQVERVVEADELAQALRGMPIQDARARLARLESPLRLVKLEIWPEWAPRAYRIEVSTVQ